MISFVLFNIVSFYYLSLLYFTVFITFHQQHSRCLFLHILTMQANSHATYIKCMLSNKMNIYRADGHSLDLSGFNDFESLVTPIFILMDHFLHQFSIFCKKWTWPIELLDFWTFGKCTIIFWQMHHQILVFLALRLSVWQFYKVL